MKKKGSGYLVFRSVIQWLSLAAFLCCVVLILVESAIPGTESQEQSDDVAGLIQSGIDSDYDSENVKDLVDFEIHLEKTELQVGERTKYEIEYLPEDTSYPSLDWNISRPEAVEVDAKEQTILALEEGEVSFELSSTKNPQLTESFVLQIRAVPVTEISLPYSEVEMEVNDTLSLQPTILPENATHKEVLYSSDRPEIVLVDDSGVLSAKKAGEATIRIQSVSSPDVTCVLSVQVKDPGNRPVSELSLSSLTLYPYQKGTISGSYGPVGSTFRLDSLSLSCADENLRISSPSHSPSTASFQFSLCYEKEISEETTLSLTARYLEGEEEKTAEAELVLLPRQEIALGQVDPSLSEERQEGVVYALSSYGEEAPRTSRNLTIDIPLSQDVRDHPERYRTDLFSYRVPDTLRILSQSYARITVAPVSTDQSFQGEILYAPNGRDTIAIPFSYIVVEDDSKIQSIEMENLFVDEEEKTNVLAVDQEYGTLLGNRILASEGPASAVFADSGVRYEVLEGEDVVEFLFEGEEAVGLKTLKTGRARIRAISKFEVDYGLSDPVSTTFTIDVVDVPSVSQIRIQGETHEEWTLRKGEQAVVEFCFSFVPTAKASLPSKEIVLPYSVVVEDESILTYSPASRTVTALKGGTCDVTFLPEDPELQSLSRTLSVTVDHVEVDQEQFLFRIQDVSHPDGNLPSEDFSRVPLHAEFSLNAQVNADATNPDVRYLSSNEDILSVDPETGYVHALALGSATLTCYSLDNPERRIEKTIEVVPVGSPFELDVASLDPLKSEEAESDGVEYLDLQLRYGTAYFFHFRVEGYATSTKVEFAFEDPSGKKSSSDVLSVDAEGRISLLSTGTTWLKVTYGSDTLSPQVAYYRITSLRDTALTFGELAALLRKVVGHFLLFFLTTMLAMHFIALLYPDLKRRLIASTVPLAFGFVVAGMSELIQMFTPGRGPTWKDVGIDFAGVAAAVLLFLILFVVIEWIRRRRKEKEAKAKDGNEEPS